MSEKGNIHRYDREVILDEVAELFQARTDWHGFISRSELEPRFEDGEVFFTHRDGEVICAVDFHHRERSHTRVYHTALHEDYWEPEVWEAIISRVLRESPHDRIISKCPVDSEENLLWRRIGTRLKTEIGTDRPLYVWEVRDG